MSRSALSRAADAVANRLDRRSFLARSALVGSALVTAPGDLLLRPGSAYAAICSCQGQGCDCGSLCCDGYTEFCCALNGVNACPPGSLTGGWWKADGASYCGGAARYYMDCHKPCGACTCGSSGICSGACNGTPCGCGRGRCDHRKAGCTSFRYGNCSNHVACIGPIQCRVVTCTPPWEIEPTCSSAAVRTDNRTRTHNRPCLQVGAAIHPVAGDWDGDGKSGIGFYDNRTGTWDVRQTATTDPVAPFPYGRQTGDVPVVGDWDGDGSAGIGIFRDSQWHLSNQLSPASTFAVTPPYGRQAGDIAVAGDWNGDGTDSLGIYRRGGEWHLTDRIDEPTTIAQFRYGVQTGDLPVVGDWNGDGVDGVGIFRDGVWHLNDALEPAATARRITFGERGDLPVVGDWYADGVVSIGFYRPREGRWHLRRSLDDPGVVAVRWGTPWVTG